MTTISAAFSGLVVVLSLVIYLAFYISAPWFALLWDEPRLVEILRTLALVFPIASIATVPLAILRREMDFKSVTIINFAAEMVGAITTLILALTGFGVWSLVLGHLAYAAMGTILPLIFCPVRVIPSFNFKSTGRFIDFGGSIILQRLVHQIYTSADVIILGRAFDTATVGVYSVALEVATMPLRKITTIVNELAFAGFSRIQDDKEKIAGYLEKPSASSSSSACRSSPACPAWRLSWSRWCSAPPGWAPFFPCSSSAWWCPFACLPTRCTKS